MIEKDFVFYKEKLDIEINNQRQKHGKKPLKNPKR